MIKTCQIGLLALLLIGVSSCIKPEPGPAERIGRGIDEITKGIGDFDTDRDTRTSPRGGGYEGPYGRKRGERDSKRDDGDYYDNDPLFDDDEEPLDSDYLDDGYRSGERRGR